MLQAVVLSLSLLTAADPVEADYVIKNATLYDGSGQPGKTGDLAIKGERIVAVGAFATKGKPVLIDGAGLIVCPGFIDLHTHSDRGIVEPATRSNLNYLMQGVTTAVTGNCGGGPVDVADYYKKIDEGKAGTNVVHQIPHNDLRRQVMGNANRHPTAAELDKMKALADQAMKAGAWGLSTGLYYTPGSYANLDELAELAKVAAGQGGFYASHIRDEGPGLLASIAEAIEVGRRAGLPVHISHMKAYSKKAWGKAADAIALVEQARAKGQVVTADQYPYVASSTSLAADTIPSIFREGTQKDLIARFDDAEQGPRIKKAIAEALQDADGGKRLRIARYAKQPDWQGKNLAALAQQQKKPPLELVLEIERNGGASIVNFSMQEEEVRLIMRRPWVATASDGSAQVPADTVLHPRHYGCFPRKIGRYAIDDKVIPLEQAIRKRQRTAGRHPPPARARLPEAGILRRRPRLRPEDLP